MSVSIGNATRLRWGRIFLRTGGGVLLLAGFALAVGEKAFAPVPAVFGAEEAVREGVTYQAGTVLGWTAWRSKESLWLEGRVDRLELSEVELNQWAERRLKSDLARMDLHPWTIIWGSPNVRLTEEEVQVALRIRFSEWFRGHFFLVQFTGRIRLGSGGLQFVPSRVTFGQVVLFNILGDALWRDVLEFYTDTPELDPIVSSLGGLKKIETRGGVFVIER